MTKGTVTVRQLVSEAKETTMSKGEDQVEFAQRLGQRPEPVRSVADIPDDELLRRAVRNVTGNKRRQEFAWAAVVTAFGLGSTYASQLCRRFGIDPDTGAELKTPNVEANWPETAQEKA